MPRDAREVEASLTKKGFQARQGKDRFFHLMVNGLKTPVWTKISQGEKEIHDGLIAAMTRQLRLSKKDFNDLIDCPLTEAEYTKRLRQAGHIA